MPIRNLTLLIYVVFSASTIFGQVNTTLHQSFVLKEEIQSIVLDFPYPVEVSTWEGTSVLTKTTIKLQNASKPILQAFIKMGRYEISKRDYAEVTSFSLKKMNRKAIETSRGICIETIQTQVFVPKNIEVRTTGKELLRKTN